VRLKPDKAGNKIKTRNSGGAVMKTHKWYPVGMATILVLLVAMLAMVAAGCGDSASAGAGPMKLTDQDNGRSFSAKVGDTIDVYIVGNPTTGYAWSAALSDKDEALFEPISEPTYVADQVAEGIVGSGGTYVFTLKAKAAGEASVKLVYSRAWENVAPLFTYEVKVTIEK
jgi:inhibitor of cysteine peptidase